MFNGLKHDQKSLTVFIKSRRFFRPLCLGEVRSPVRSPVRSGPVRVQSSCHHLRGVSSTYQTSQYLFSPAGVVKDVAADCSVFGRTVSAGQPQPHKIVNLPLLLWKNKDKGNGRRLLSSPPYRAGPAGQANLKSSKLFLKS